MASVDAALALRGEALAAAVAAADGGEWGGDDEARRAKRAGGGDEAVSEAASAAALSAALVAQAAGSPGSAEAAALALGVADVLVGGPARLIRALGIHALDWVHLAVGGGTDDMPPDCLKTAFRLNIESVYAVGGASAAVGAAVVAVYRAWARAAPRRARALLGFITGSVLTVRASHSLAASSCALTVCSAGLPPRGVPAAKATLRALPTAHSCANSLEVPDYAAALRVLGSNAPDVCKPEDVGVADALEVELKGFSAIDAAVARLLEERLGMAVDGSEGYDLDDL